MTLYNPLQNLIPSMVFSLIITFIYYKLTKNKKIINSVIIFIISLIIIFMILFVVLQPTKGY